MLPWDPFLWFTQSLSAATPLTHSNLQVIHINLEGIHVMAFNMLQDRKRYHLGAVYHEISWQGTQKGISGPIYPQNYGVLPQQINVESQKHSPYPYI